VAGRRAARARDRGRACAGGELARLSPLAARAPRRYPGDMGKKPDLPDSTPIEQIELKSALEERYLAYALSTITHRALPDVRDGLKPVHRRILYGMRLLRLDPNGAFKKSAKIVGDVMGSFHPHGDQAIYDALVRLAQDFASRWPLVDGQGNFGNVDGDNAAAYRYTEARLTETAQRLLEGIDEDAVDFRANYDGSSREPAVLPAAFPNLLANGASGIAVGMATSIPPHNAAELIAAARHLVAHPKATTADLLAFVPGPDFPTGGVIVDDKAAVAQAYETGRGSFRLRARWKKEEIGRGGYVVVVTEIPYGVPKARLIEKLAELVIDKKVPLLENVTDESAEDVRIVLEPKSRNVDPVLLMETLFRLSELETRVPLNMNVLVRGAVPMVLGLRDVLRHWLDHRRDVLVRRSRWRLAEIERRLEVLAGYIVAYLNLDEVIRIIREHDEPKAELMRVFALTDVQATAILDMRLRSLRRLEEMALRREHEELTKEKSSIEGLLASDKQQWRTVGWQLGELAKAYDVKKAANARRTSFGEAPAAVDVDVRDALVEREPVTVILSEKGWIRALKGHVQDLSGLQFKAEDALKSAVFAQTTDQLLMFATNGKFYTLDPAKLPGGRGHGEPVRLMVDLDQGHEVVDVLVHEPGGKLLVATGEGRGFVVAEADVIANTRKGKQVLNLDPPDVARFAVKAKGDMVATVGENRKLLCFPLADVPEMPRGKGVRLQTMREGGLADLATYAGAEGLSWRDSAGRSFKLEPMADYVGRRAGAGRLAPKGFPRNGKFRG
jgi:topoisomerase-4 subunit A